MGGTWWGHRWGVGSTPPSQRCRSGEGQHTPIPLCTSPSHPLLTRGAVQEPPSDASSAWSPSPQGSLLGSPIPPAKHKRLALGLKTQVFPLWSLHTSVWAASELPTMALQPGSCRHNKIDAIPSKATAEFPPDLQGWTVSPDILPLLPNLLVIKKPLAEVLAPK